MMQDLIAQTEYFPSLRSHRQTIVGNVSSLFSVANLPKINQCLVGCKIQFRCVMQDQNWFVNLIYLIERSLTMCIQNRLVSNIVTMHHAIKSLQVCWTTKFLWQCTTGTQAHLINQFDQSLRPTLVAKLCVIEIHFTETLYASHTRPSVNIRAGYQSVALNHPRTIKLSAYASDSKAS